MKLYWVMFLVKFSVASLGNRVEKKRLYVERKQLNEKIGGDFELVGLEI